jgi:cytochrome c-type biogenesis protein CcmH
MIRRRTLLGALLLAPLAPAALLATAETAHAQGMDRSGVLDIQSDDERRIFTELQCTCGCPRESIVTCTCSTAAGFRKEVRAMMAEGLTHEQIKAEWVKRFGPQALMVPPNAGGNRLLYVAPLVAIVAMAAFVVTILRRFQRRGAEKAAAEAVAPVATSGPDEYDQRLDEELKQLDDE